MTTPSHPAHTPGIWLITGGSRGIGAATALLAAARGYDLASMRRVETELERQVVRELGLGQLQPRRAAINHAANRRTVAFAKGGDCE